MNRREFERKRKDWFKMATKRALKRKLDVLHISKEGWLFELVNYFGESNLKKTDLLLVDGERIRPSKTSMILHLLSLPKDLKTDSYTLFGKSDPESYERFRTNAKPVSYTHLTLPTKA